MSTTTSRRKQQTVNTMTFLRNRTADFIATPTRNLDVVVKRDESITGNLTVGKDLRANNFYASGNFYLDNYILIPPGTIIASAAINPPEGWLVCDGREVLIDQYPNLYNAIGDTYHFIGNYQDGQTFMLPDLRGRTIIGVGTGRVYPGGSLYLTQRALGDAGGEENHILTINEMPSHSHTSNANGGNNGIGLVSDTDTGTTQTTNDSPNEHNIVNPPIALVIDASGGGLPHNNMQPFFALNYLIKY